MRATVTTAEIVAGLDRVGAGGQRLIVHASLSSFGHVVGGAEAVVNALVSVAETVVVPTFTFSPALAVPNGDRLPRNGADYDQDPCGSTKPTLFHSDLEVARPLGTVAETMRRHAGAVRSSHPLSSFAAVGAAAARYVRDHAWDKPLLPVARLRDDGGSVLMLGTPLTSCTAIHLGEQQAGRRAFIRWVRDAEGRARRVRVGGCSQGFDQLAPHMEGVAETAIGEARVRRLSIASVLQATVDCLARDPLALVCPARCRRCLDAVAGGPLE